MKTSESIAKLAEALVKAQPQIRAAVKSSENPFFKSKYADLSEVWDACREALHANGLMILQGCQEGDGKTMTLDTRLLHVSGEWIESSTTLAASKPDPQGIGSAITYARRYALAAMVGVCTEDDDGNAASAPESTKKMKAAPLPDRPVLAEFSRLWVQLPEKKRNDIAYCATFLPLVVNWEDVRNQNDEALSEAIDKLNLILSETK